MILLNSSSYVYLLYMLPSIHTHKVSVHLYVDVSLKMLFDDCADLIGSGSGSRYEIKIRFK